MYCGVASLCTCTSSKNIQWPISSTFLLCIWAYLKLGNPEIHWLIIMFALKWRCYDMLCHFGSIPNLQTRCTVVVVPHAHTGLAYVYIYMCACYIYILYIHWNFQILLYTHYHSSISLKPLSYLIHILFISHVYTIPWICHEIPWQKKQDGTLSQSDLLGALDLASNSLAPSGTPRVPARSWVKIWRFVAHISYVPESWQCSTKISSCLTDELIFWLAWFTKIDETHKNSVRGIRGHFPFPCLIGGSLPV